MPLPIVDPSVPLELPCGLSSTTSARELVASNLPSESSVPLLVVGKFDTPPSRNSAAFTEARRDLERLVATVKQRRNLDAHIVGRIIAMLAFVHFYTEPSLNYSWSRASEMAATGCGKGVWLARQLRTWTSQYIKNRKLPTVSYRNAQRSLVEDEDLTLKLKVHIQSLDKFFSAADIVWFIGRPEMLDSLGLEKSISLSTACRWLKAWEYRYGKEKNGMFIDGHERKDVVDFRQLSFLPKWKEYERRMLLRERDGEIIKLPTLRPGESQIVLNTHDESTYYANDQRTTRWIHSSERPKPVRKGEGKSIMISDFCNPESGWLRTEDGRSARIVFKAGKNRDGYFVGDDLFRQVSKAIDIFEERCPYHTGLFAFDNARTHQKRAPDALSARKTPKNPKIWHPHPGVRMRSGQLPNGEPQDLYQPDGKFKGMKQILRERGLWTTEKRAECPGFKCPNDSTDCCARRMLFTQPDFAGQKSALEELVESRGHLVIFYPKFYCELNFIEMVWGSSKYTYRMMEHPINEDAMERNIVESLDSVPLSKMRRFFNRACRFIHAYDNGLTGSQAAWANKKFHSHRTLPPELIAEARSQNDL